jgi:hypothetical protein
MKAVIKVSREEKGLRIVVKNEGEHPLALKNPNNDSIVSENSSRNLLIGKDEHEVQFEITERST